MYQKQRNRCHKGLIKNSDKVILENASPSFNSNDRLVEKDVIQQTSICDRSHLQDNYRASQQEKREGMQIRSFSDAAIKAEAFEKDCKRSVSSSDDRSCLHSLLKTDLTYPSVQSVQLAR